MHCHKDKAWHWGGHRPTQTAGFILYKHLNAPCQVTEPTCRRASNPVISPQNQSRVCYSSTGKMPCTYHNIHMCKDAHFTTFKSLRNSEIRHDAEARWPRNAVSSGLKGLWCLLLHARPSTDPCVFLKLQARTEEATVLALSSVVAGKEVESKVITLHRELEREYPSILPFGYFCTEVLTMKTSRLSFHYNEYVIVVMFVTYLSCSDVRDNYKALRFLSTSWMKCSLFICVKWYSLLRLSFKSKKKVQADEKILSWTPENVASRHRE